VYLLFIIILIALSGIFNYLISEKRERHPSLRELGMAPPPKPNKLFFGDGNQPLPKDWQHTRQSVSITH
jgi:hypothetical protein